MDNNNLPATKEFNTPQELSLKNEEEEKRIAEVKLKINNERISKLQKKATDLGVILDDESDDKVYIPLNKKQKQVIEKYENRTHKVQPSQIVYTDSSNEEDKRKITIETNDGYPLSSGDLSKLFSATINEATGCNDLQYGIKIFEGCYKACGFYKEDGKQGENVTAILEAMRAMQPKDEYEGQLIARLIALHEQSMKYLRGVDPCLPGTSQQYTDLCVNRTAKLSRLYNETLEALMRYRRKGEQKVVVQHVNVENGGQAVVGGMISGNGRGV